MMGTPAMKPVHLLLAASALAMAIGTPAAAQTLPDSFDVGRGPQGELCRAQRVWNDPAAKGLFDSVYVVRCRGWTDTTNVGRIGLYEAGTAALEGVRAGVAGRMTCSVPGAITIPGLGTGEAARCRNGEGGYAAFTATTQVKRQLLAMDGLERFSANLAAAALRGMVDGGLDVWHHAVAGQGFHGGFQLKPGTHVGICIAQFDAGLDALEGGRRHRHIAFGRIAVGHGANVRIDAKDFLQHHDGAARLTGRLRHIGGKRKTIGRRERGELTHV